jgi:predicted amidohydrolase
MKSRALLAAACLFASVSLHSATSGSVNLIPNPAFQPGGNGPSNWSTWSPRSGLAPHAEVVRADSGNQLSLRSSRFPMYGEWSAVVTSIAPQKYYLFEILQRTENVRSEDLSAAALLSWCKDENGVTPIQRDYVDRVAPAGDWHRVYRTLQAPPGTHSVKVSLVFRWSDAGAVYWKSPSLSEVPPVRHRIVRVATTHLIPNYPATVESNLDLMSGILDRAGASHADIVCLSETFADRGLKLSLPERANKVFGPASAMLCAKARQHRMYVVATLPEMENGVAYNSALLIDRSGKIAGKYRKTHTPLAEAEDGYTPANDYPVFDTDFGRVGILICWDNWFPESARILRLRGAEMLLFPSAGDGNPRHYDVITRARAIDNGLYVISSNTVGDSLSRIIDPTGDVLAEVHGASGLAVTELDLDREWRTHWLSVGPSDGEARSVYIKERRPDTYGAIGGTGLQPMLIDSAQPVRE